MLCCNATGRKTSMRERRNGKKTLGQKIPIHLLQSRRLCSNKHWKEIKDPLNATLDTTTQHYLKH